MTASRPRPVSPLRVLLTLVLGGGSLAVLAALDLVDLGPVGAAFRRRPFEVGLAAAGVAGVAVLGAVRYVLVARLFRLSAPKRHVLAANFISQAVGQWTSGAMAVAEVLRFGLMSGLAEDRESDGGKSGPGRLARVGLSILVDRSLGFGAAFALGGAAGLAHLLGGGGSRRTAVLLALTAFSAAVGGLLLAGPFLGPGRRAAARLGRRFAGRTGRVGRAALGLVQAVELWPGGREEGPSRTAVLGLSAATAFLNPLTLYFASVAVGRPIPILVVLAAVPFTVLAVVIPAGIAGFGGPQLLAAGIFGLFGIDPAAVVAAGLLQNTVVLIAQTFLGGAGAALAFDRLRAARRNR